MTGGGDEPPAGPGPPSGAVAQLGERLICIQEVVGSIPISSTNFGRRRKAPPQGPPGEGGEPS